MNKLNFAAKVLVEIKRVIIKKNTLSYNRPIEQDALRARYESLKALTCETTSLFGEEGLN